MILKIIGMEQEEKIAISKDPQEIQELISQGYCPIGCFVDGISYVDGLMLDNHGIYSSLEHFALRAYRDHYGIYSEDSTGVVISEVNLANVFTIAALFGKLSDEYPLIDEKTNTTTGARDTVFYQLVFSIVKWSTEYFDSPLFLPQGAFMFCLTQNVKHGDTMDGVVQYLAKLELIKLAVNGDLDAKRLIAADWNDEMLRVICVKAMLFLHSYTYQRMVCIKSFEDLTQPENGFPEWFQRTPELGGEFDVQGWLTPIVVIVTRKKMIVRCPNKTVAAKLFGESGLYSVYDRLQGNTTIEKDHIDFKFKGIDHLEAQVFDGFDFDDLGSWLFGEIYDCVIFDDASFANL